MPILNEKVKATCSITIVDETDASTLSGTLLVVSGSKNQIYLTGQNNPFSPDWSVKNLILRPFLQASNVTKTTAMGETYNPDLFSPEEFPSALNTYDYIKSIHWYIRDSAGVETELYDSDEYSFSHEYNINGERVVCSDSRQLVIKNNVLLKNSTADIICKFSFFDPFANIYVSQQYECNLVNIASGLSNSKLVTTCVNGDTITNNSMQYIDIIARFYGDTGEEDIGTEIDEGAANVSCLWYIRRHDGWTLLDPTADGQNLANQTTPLYAIKRILNYDDSTGIYELEDYAGAKGNAAIRIYPALINGAEMIKCVYTDYTGARYISLQTINDMTDDTIVKFHSSNGTRLRKGYVESTIIKAIITYKGTLLEEDSPLYDTEFDYYWYKYTRSDDAYMNVFNDFQNNIVENADLNEPVAGLRTLYIDIDDISPEEKECEIVLDLVEKEIVTAEYAQTMFFASAITEEDLGIAMRAMNDIGLIDDYEAAIFTAQELNAE